MDFDANRRWALNDSVVIRPEAFGALAYDARSRRLSVLKSPLLVRVLQQLGEHYDVTAAMRAAGVPPRSDGAVRRGLASLAAAGLLVERS